MLIIILLFKSLNSSKMHCLNREKKKEFESIEKFNIILKCIQLFSMIIIEKCFE